MTRIIALFLALFAHSFGDDIFIPQNFVVNGADYSCLARYDVDTALLNGAILAYNSSGKNQDEIFEIQSKALDVTATAIDENGEVIKTKTRIKGENFEVYFYDEAKTKFNKIGILNESCTISSSVEKVSELIRLHIKTKKVVAIPMAPPPPSWTLSVVNKSK